MLVHDFSSCPSNSTNQLFLDASDNVFLFHVKLVTVALFGEDGKMDTVHPLPVSDETNKKSL